MNPDLIESTTTSLIPADVLVVLSSSMLSKKERTSMLIDWFMKNWYLWIEQPAALPINTNMSIPEFSNALTNSLSLYNIHISGQRIWTWISKRNLPRQDNFRVMANIATGWQKEFALQVLCILNSDDQKTIDQEQ